MTLEERAYIAGIVDGEGCITLSQTKTVYGKETYRAMVIVETTSEVLQQYLVKVTGQGDIRRNPHSGNHKDRYLWCLAGKTVIKNFLLEIEPYLVIKKQHANIMLDFLSEDELHYGKGCIAGHLDKYRAYRQLFRKLNFRGRIENLANSEKPLLDSEVTPNQTPETDVCVETNVQGPKGVI
jgi:hypothetical protein